MKKNIFQKVLNFWTEKNIVILMGFFAFCCYLIFSYSVPFNYFDHDLGSIYGSYGHIGYIRYILQNWSLPVFTINPVTKWSFYNPPLHHILSALWLQGSLWFTDSLQKGLEWLQVLTSIYIGLTLIFSYKILNLLKIKHKLLAWIYLCFNPMFFILSSSINNDCLLLLTTTATFYYGLSWYYEPKMKTMLKAAIWTGFGLMTKFNEVLSVFILALLFCIRFIKYKTNRTFYIKQLLLYLLLACPIGGWYYGYAYLRYQMPPNYVQGIRDPNSDIGGRHTLYERFTHNEWSNPYVDLKTGKNWNMIALGLKTACFDEKNYSDTPYLTRIGETLFLLNSIFFFIILFLILRSFLYTPLSKWKLPVLFVVYI